MTQTRDLLIQLYRAGVDAADPKRATRQAVAALDDVTPAAWVFAVGKGAHAMASGAVEALGARHVTVAGGFVVAHAFDPAATHGLDVATGDHPVPGAGSLAAADGLQDGLGRVPSNADALILVSGGTTSLIAAPVRGISAGDLKATFDTLLASGADITLMNEVRKRILRFGGGGLARALASRRVHCLIASDVIGNDPGSIGSGPCVPLATSARDVVREARQAGAWDRLPAAVRAHIEAEDDRRGAGAQRRFETTTVRVILDRTDAERGVQHEAHRLGLAANARSEPMSGEAAHAGTQFARDLLGIPRTSVGCVIWSGECTVNLGDGDGSGGRCQEFALACALEFERAGAASRGITVLAAGTDGRDGPTDVAGAVVDHTTCSTIRAHGIDPGDALRRHDSYGALDSAGALLRTGPTGTNVNDLVIALTGQRITPDVHLQPPEHARLRLLALDATWITA